MECSPHQHHRAQHEKNPRDHIRAARTEISRLIGASSITTYGSDAPPCAGAALSPRHGRKPKSTEKAHTAAPLAAASARKGVGGEETREIAYGRRACGEGSSTAWTLP
eukprot:SAG11_NODE_15549_length_574_cov_1.181053_1_plen_107_part_10